MASRSKKNSAPLTFDLPLELIAKLKTSRKTRGLKSTSEMVRLAIEEFDFDACSPNHEAHRQVSVRVATVQRAMLKRFARTKGSSVGELLRLALESLAATPARAARR